MNYPIWELPTYGGGLLIAVIAICHTYISQLAVGGGIFLYVLDRKATADNDPLLAEFVQRHTKFFLLLTMVFGGVTGVGIWFVIGLVHPAGTSTLIHNFVFAWAIEWVFFLVEIVALLIYHYQHKAMSTQLRHQIALIYAVAAWLSLFVINGILTFMLTPGKWLSSHDFWDGFFNPSAWPSLVYRTLISMMFAGIFAFVTAAATKDDDFRQRLMRIASRWLLYPMTGAALAAVWYLQTLPEPVKERLYQHNPEAAPFVSLFIVTSILLVLGGSLLYARMPRIVQVRGHGTADRRHWPRLERRLRVSCARSRASPTSSTATCIRTPTPIKGRENLDRDCARAGCSRQMPLERS
jgi:hypothetical protein